MNYDDNIYAEVVFDGHETHAPARMGEPKTDQLQGTTLERLVELAGRVCYDSLGKGRSSADYHDHIAEVGHGSVWEHANMTFRVPRGPRWVRKSAVSSGEVVYMSWLDTALLFLNRPGVWVRFGDDGALRVTMNLRSIIEFDQFTEPSLSESERTTATVLRLALWGAAMPYVPQIVSCAREYWDVTVVEPEHPEEKWVSLLIGGSRGMSHEQVRHGDRTAISQRSTRYVDESESPWTEHPLLTEFFAEADVPLAWVELHDGGATFTLRPLSAVAGAAYAETVAALQPWLEARGVDKHTARKQARGAARGYLGNALHTELIFSASVAQWRRMFAQRCTVHADAEIRVLYSKALPALKTTKWADDFADFNLVPSPDGIGEVIG